MLLDQILFLVPCPIFWKNLDGNFLGCNKLFLEISKLQDYSQLVGKKDDELPWKEFKDEYYRDDQHVINTGETITRIERIPLDGRIIVSETTKTPLLQDGKTIGVLGICLDITDRKEKEQLMLENQAHQSAVEEQEKFRKIVKQVMHDITSPISSIDNIISRLGSNIPEADRVTLRNASMRIAGISQRLLSQYNDENLEAKNESFLVSLALLQIINEKTEEYREQQIKFDVDIDKEVNFTFIKHSASVFKRMISNLVNNSVDALKNTSDGKITIHLGAHADKAVITIQDNGSGMPQHIIEKFNQGVGITEGKENGHGVGLTQVYDAITSGNGTCKIHSSKDGTRITIRFPSVPTPSWLATEIKLNSDDTVIILDDDESIHGSWDKNFESVLEKNPALQIKHFYQGMEVIAYINNLTSAQKQGIVLLADFELLEQGINGLDVIAQTNMHRAILVTSYSSNKDKQIEVTRAGIKMLPKELAASAIIKIEKNIKPESQKVDMVWVEDQKWYIDDIVFRHYSHLKVDKYYDPITFMENVRQYPLDVRIILDTYYEAEDGEIYDVTGYDLARELHALGYTNLIILTGEDPEGRAPNYLKVVRKINSAALENMDKL